MPNLSPGRARRTGQHLRAAIVFRDRALADAAVASSLGSPYQAATSVLGSKRSRRSGRWGLVSRGKIGLLRWNRELGRIKFSIGMGTLQRGKGVVDALRDGLQPLWGVVDAIVKEGRWIQILEALIHIHKGEA